MTHSIKDTVSAVKEKIVSGTALLFQTIQICRGVLRLPYKNGYLSTVCCDIAMCYLFNKGSGIVGETIVAILVLVALYYVVKFLFNHADFDDHDDGPGGSTGNPFV